MQQRTLPARISVYTGTQMVAVVIVLLAIFTLPCCPRVDGWFGAAQANAAEVAASAESPTYHHDHQHHQPGVTTERDSTSSLHKGHLMTTGAIDVLPDLSPFVLGTLIPLARVGLDRAARLSLLPQPRIPVPPPRPAA